MMCKNIFRIDKELTNKNNGAFKYHYYFNFKEIDAREFKKHLLFMIKHYNKLYYDELINVYHRNYVNHYKYGNYDLLLDYKDVLSALKNEGVYYTFGVGLGA